MGLKEKLKLPKINKAELKDGMTKFVDIMSKINANQIENEKKIIQTQKNQAYQEKYLIAICKKLGIKDEDLE